MSTALKLPPIEKRPRHYAQGWVDQELWDEVVKAIPDGVKQQDAIQRALVHLLVELNPKAAKRLLEVLK